MGYESEALARNITKASCKQTHFIIDHMVDRILVADCFRAYSYFRWIDDRIDSLSLSPRERREFITKEEGLVNDFYKGRYPKDLLPEERILADLIRNDRGRDPYLRSYIENFFEALRFDTGRHGRRINEEELHWYSDHIAKAVTDCIFHFVNAGNGYPEKDERYLAATAAHIAHMLRDYRSDLGNGYINIQSEYLDGHGIGPGDIESEHFRKWVEERVDRARRLFRKGKGYIRDLPVLRSRIIAYWYCDRFERVLDRIEKDDYHLRSDYNDRPSFLIWVNMVWIAIRETAGHLNRRTVVHNG